jgi:outer membrane protein OmpA-like peptidoglycan-associated protein
MTFAPMSKSKTKPAVSRKRAANKVAPTRSVVESLSGLGGRSAIAPTIQPKLKIGEPNDKFEQEADRVADEVMRMPDRSESDTLSFPRQQSQVSALQGPLIAKFWASNQLSSVSRNEHNSVQRLCKKCDEEVQTAMEPSKEDEIEVQTKLASAKNANPVVADSMSLNALKGGGHPLPKATRSFFEQRMGHDFNNVRLHTDIRANELAQSLNARAFTHGNHIVFRTGEYQHSISTGRYLLAHELAHTIQQGASRPLGIQTPIPESSIRANSDIGQSTVPKVQRIPQPSNDPPPADLVCDPAVDSHSIATSVTFAQGGSTLSPAAQATLSSIAAAWHTAGGTEVLRIDGFASAEGGSALNWRLSCDRAIAVALELEAPSDGSPGVPNTHLEMFAQGETDLFSSTSLAPNRAVSIVSSSGAPAAGPPCGLTVSGPTEVDHYCAAYVPSDAASCGVFPAPNITLTVAGAAASSTPRWSIIRGGANASIAGSNTGASIAIQGDAASGTQGDVTVQVTDGTCTTTHFLTVREPSEMTSAQNPSSGPTFIQNLITYTVHDQFGNPMGANICVDETITLCAQSRPATLVFGDAGTDASGQVQDQLQVSNPSGIAPGLCRKLNQSLTAGGCGPLLNNTILFQNAGITLTHNDSCRAGDPCP